MRGRSDWLGAMQAAGLPKGVMRISALQNAADWPGMLLPGTYNGVMCLDLLGGLNAWAARDRKALTEWLEAHRLPDGRFRVPGMQDADVFKKPDREETWRYIDWHVSNYSLGAIDALRFPAGGRSSASSLPISILSRSRHGWPTVTCAIPGRREQHRQSRGGSSC